jgi:hypothetical protein
MKLLIASAKRLRTPISAITPPIFNIKKIANKNSINGTLKSEICCNSYFVFKQISAVLIKLLQIVLIKLFAITQHLKYQFTLRNFGADWA